MRLFCRVAVLVCIAWSVNIAQAKAVFAHFMVGNCKTWEQANWEADMKLAQQAHIDAFALNIANNESGNPASIAKAFQAANSVGFKLFFSFDYAGNGAYDKNTVISYLNEYGSLPSYFKVDGKPLASTFEGPGNAADWIEIKDQTGCHFLPDWSSAGSKGALSLSPGVVDGLMSWAAWPWGNLDMNTYVDASYLEFLKAFSFTKPLQYLMPVSPWFYTNLPGYEKNWIWKGDDLWFDRWQEVWVVNPDFVEILTWNDYGESHYVGPLHDDGMEAFTIGKAPFNYVTNMPHDGWRLLLPFAIDTYKNGIATVGQEVLVSWFRLSPKSACADGRTTGNTASQLQVEFFPADVAQDKIFYTAVLGSSASVKVTIGGVDLGATWTTIPDGNIGMYHGSVAYGAATGQVVVSVGSMVITGESITTNCNRVVNQNGLTNWNPWVGSALGATSAAKPALNLSDQKCIKGMGAPGYEGLCSFSCHYGYCPIGACTCLAMGRPVVNPASTGVVGYPAEGRDQTYEGLCNFACNLGYCPSTACDTSPHPMTVPTVSPFLPSACIEGSGAGNLGGLCSYSCNFGFCPIRSCQCNFQGALTVPPPTTGGNGRAAAGVDSFLYDSLCKFTCSRGYCPPDACMATGTKEGTGDFMVYVSPSVWIDSAPIVLLGCFPPCTLILPPFTLAAPTTIEFEPYVTVLEVFIITATVVTTFSDTLANTQKVSTVTKGQTSFTTTTIIIPPLTTSVIPLWNIEIDPEDFEDESIISITRSILPPIVTITATSSGTPYARTIHPPPWPYVQPSPTTWTEGPPPIVSWTRSAAGPACTANCGTRCVGLFCKVPCLFDCVKIPDPDWWDSVDPYNPWPPGSPYVPDDPKCTTTSASSCSTQCITGAATSTCTSSCSLRYDCSASPTTTRGTFTLAPFGYFTVDSFDRASDANPAFTSSVDAELAAVLNEWFPTPVEPTTVTTTLPDTTITVTPTADCAFKPDDGIFVSKYLFTIYNIQYWAETDGGEKLHDEESGCGATSEWTWQDAANGEKAKVTFYLPFVLTGGCVERAIVSAGGPKIQCQYYTDQFPARDESSVKTPTKISNVTYAVSLADGFPLYSPQVWYPLLLPDPLNEKKGHGIVALRKEPTPDKDVTPFILYDVSYPISTATNSSRNQTVTRRHLVHLASHRRRRGGLN